MESTVVPRSPCRDAETGIPLALHRLRFEIVFRRPGRLPSYPGSAIRGLLGHGMRRVLCVTRQPVCGGCLLRERCGYATFFETPGHASRHAAAPHPWLLDLELPTPREVQPGERLVFGITLMGEGGKALPWLVLALEHAGTLGFGREDATFSLAGLWQEAPVGSDRWVPLTRDALPELPTDATGAPLPSPMSPRVRLHLQTPLRLKRRGRLVTPESFDMPTLLVALRRRVQDLVALHGHDEVAFPSIPETADVAVIRRHLRWQDWTRWSNRQKTRMQLGGVIGEMELDTAPLVDWWPLLWLGQWLHIGKQTSMGLGQYRLDTSL